MNRQVPGRDRLTRADLVALYEANVDDLYRFCLARTGSQVVAEDATAEAFVAAARSFAAGRGSEIDRPWLFVVARRRIVDQWRSADRNRKRIERFRAAAPGERSARGDPSDVDETSEHVLAALQSLPSRQRAALTLRYLDECSVAEVAAALHIEYRAAESLLARGRRGFSKAWRSMSPRQDERT